MIASDTFHGWAPDLSAMTEEELRRAYNAAAKPNAYGEELLRRIHLRDQRALGMSADSAALRDGA